ncbi:MAG: hypothetical protein ACLGH8_05215 [Bacteroidia bacterium]
MELKLVENHKEFFNSCYERNFDLYKIYLDYRPIIFVELPFNIGEIVRCLVIEANTAAITLTNHMLERLLKLTLIEDEMELRPLTHPWSDCWDRMYPYFDWNMDKTINQCAIRQIISGKQKKQLQKYREVFRNGFSHAATDLIFKDYPETFTTRDSYNDMDVTHNLKKDPRNQLYFLQKIAKENAHSYFKYVFDLIESIEKSLQRKYPGNLILIPIEGGGFVRLSAKGWSPKKTLQFILAKDSAELISLNDFILKKLNAEVIKEESEDGLNYEVTFDNPNLLKEFIGFVKAINPDASF